MIAVDTNVLVRLLTRDEPDQFQRAVDLFAAEAIFIPDTVVLETAWVLGYAYGFERDAISAAFRKLFGLPNVNLQQPSTLELTLAWYENGLDFADALHLSQSLHCRSLSTFDKRFVRDAQRVASLPVNLV